MFSIGFMCVVFLVAGGHRDCLSVILGQLRRDVKSPLYLQRNWWLREKEKERR